MNCYPLRNAENSGRIKRPLQTLNNKAFIHERYDYYLTAEMNHSYRLHAKHRQRMHDFYAYEIHCPDCGGILKLAGPPINDTELGLYTCKSCGYC